MTEPLQFVFAVLLLLGVPGPTNTVMATAGAVNRGERPWRFMLAEVAAYLSIILIYRFALVPLIDAYPSVGIALKVAVVLYLIYAAVKLWRLRRSDLDAAPRVTPRLVFITTLLNPKGLVFAISIIPRDPPVSLYLGAFALMVLGVGALWFLAGRGAALISGRHAGLLPRLGSIALVGFAGYLATTIGS
jgi:threonine/homoserine/homoserine lactone efflux protein